MNKKIFISTGEVSGDLHGSLLSKALFDEARKYSINLEIYGLGGQKMKNEGVQIFQDTTSISSIGIWEALPLIIPIMKVQKKFYKFIKKYRPNCLILIDYMGPNIKIGTKLKKLRNNIPIYYYIAPQEWAWRVGNNSTTNLINFSDKIFAIFKQEAIFYKRRGGNVFWIGHPMIDLTKNLPSKKDSRIILKLRANQNILLLMPASRSQELRYILPTFLKTAKKLQLRYPSLVVYIPSCRKVFDKKFRKGLEKYGIQGKVISQQDDSELMPYIYSLSKLALCKSGTVNMELALHGIPQIVGYRVSRVTAFIAKKILNFKVKFISPVNLLLKKLIIPEFVQQNFNEKKIFNKACRLLNTTSEKAKVKKGYALLKKELGEEGVVERAAKEIINSII
ncbi:MULTISPECIES: lipid-A-disaccharide synthase [Prochlorococcus]|uniref:Lipid-A-disaccharide synthase n=1 Tax=Prochlorococcus marinus str. MIT 9116 TaxID=167544 RepID=A0A0A1ZUW2_PROMR|nr:lipid-A-disaccharide synthase [Prochlorococcus marinus]KGF91628.1 Lipid-A-disaccharide synthase [Prochlorococcus marinus str. MIT 9107]KGF93185.1 Lipid-A-disaccharide synthase [Prochlorococcus marinus str. MIT 9116]KGF94220.1 Lipid-A-disaccharide synthase [Prochlorococcus marinus str. MIT 9123]